MPAKLTMPVHFEDFSGEQFERLVFAYHLRTERWRFIDWNGQVGSDLGRDIFGVREDDRQADGLRVCIQCVNRKALTASKIERDIKKAATAPTGKPHLFRFVCRSKISAELRDKARAAAKKSDISECHVWSGPEFEERLRADTESLLARFVEGVEFPDDAKDLSALVLALPPLDDREIVALMARLFDRPAFYTPFRSESSVPAFKQALTDTIGALNTGLRRTRDGIELGRVPSRHDVSNPTTRARLAEIERGLARLRARFDELVKVGDIKPCGCGKPECSVFVSSDRAASEMDHLREEILRKFTGLHPAFDVRVAPL